MARGLTSQSPCFIAGAAQRAQSDHGSRRGPRLQHRSDDVVGTGRADDDDGELAEALAVPLVGHCRRGLGDDIVGLGG